jgi:hypothetical protein
LSIKEFQQELEEEKKNSRFPEGIGQIVVQQLDDLWNNKNFKVIDDTFSEDCVCNGSFGQSVGKKEFKNKIVLPLFNAFPDIK